MIDDRRSEGPSGGPFVGEVGEIVRIKRPARIGVHNRWGFGNPRPSATALGCTTSQSNAHGTELEVLYPWHPWFEKRAIVDLAMIRSGQAILRCRLVEDLAGKTREIPQWMFDPAVCCLMIFCEEPRVSVEALRRLVRLLKTQTET